MTSTASESVKAKLDLLTPEQLERMGIESKPPEEVRCEHCGRPKRQLALVCMHRAVWLSQECGCDGERAANEAKAAKEAADEKARYAKALRGIGIPPRHQKAVIDDVEAARFLANFDGLSGQGLYIQGVCGSGKTSLACALARSLHDAKRRVRVTTAIDMLGDIKETFDKDVSTSEVINRFVTCDLLVIDDLGKESAGDWAVRTLFQILDARYGEMRSTIITSEYTPPDLGRRMSRQGFGDPATAILSRLMETFRRIKRPDIDYRSMPGGYPGRGGSSRTE